MSAAVAEAPARSRNLLRMADLSRKLGGVVPSTIYRWEHHRDPKLRFPSRVQLGENSVGWYEDEVDAWLNGRPRGPKPSASADECRA